LHSVSCRMFCGRCFCPFHRREAFKILQICNFVVDEFLSVHNLLLTVGQGFSIILPTLYFFNIVRNQYLQKGWQARKQRCNLYHMAIIPVLPIAGQNCRPFSRIDWVFLRYSMFSYVFIPWFFAEHVTIFCGIRCETLLYGAHSFCFYFYEDFLICTLAWKGSHTFLINVCNTPIFDNQYYLRSSIRE